MVLLFVIHLTYLSKTYPCPVIFQSKSIQFTILTETSQYACTKIEEVNGMLSEDGYELKVVQYTVYDNTHSFYKDTGKKRKSSDCCISESGIWW